MLQIKDLVDKKNLKDFLFILRHQKTNKQLFEICNKIIKLANIYIILFKKMYKTFK